MPLLRPSSVPLLVVQDVRTDRFYSNAAGEQVLVAGEINLAHRTATESFFKEVARVEQAATWQGVFRARFILRTGCHIVFIADFATRALTHR